MFRDSLAPTEFPAIPGKADPEDLQDMMAATGPWATRATQDPRAPAASSGPAGPKDRKGRKASPTLCPQRTATNTGGNLESLDWSACRGLPAALGPWDRWVRLEPQEDRDHLDPLDPKDSQATEDLVFMEKKAKRETWGCRDPAGFHQTTVTSRSPRRDTSFSQSSIRVKKEARENPGE